MYSLIFNFLQSFERMESESQKDIDEIKEETPHEEEKVSPGMSKSEKNKKKRQKRKAKKKEKAEIEAEGEEDNFENELRWCIEQINFGLQNKEATSEQSKEQNS